MSSKNTLSEAQTILARAAGTLSVLSGVPRDVLSSASVEMDTYHDAMTALETNAKALGDHLAAVSTLIRLVEKESRQLKKRNKNAYAVLRKITHGKRPTSRSQPRLLAPMESELVASEAPDKGKRRKSQA